MLQLVNYTRQRSLKIEMENLGYRNVYEILHRQGIGIMPISFTIAAVALWLIVIFESNRNKIIDV